MKCRICHSDKLEMFLDLGEQPLADNFLTREQLSEPEAVYPLQVFFCHDCTLVQLGHVVPSEVLYNDDYPYETGVNKGGVKHFRKFAEEVVSKCDLQKGASVIDIGSNDGTLLKQFQSLGCEVKGIEPVYDLAVKAVRSGIPTSVEFLGQTDMEDSAEIVTATNVVAHIDDLHEFVSCMKALLADDGVFVMEVPYLPDMLNSVDFGQIYHEHLSYFSTAPLQKLFEMHDMVIINAEWQDVHGGSMRYYVGKKPQKSWLIKMEEPITMPRLNLFAQNVWDFRNEFVKLLYEITIQDKMDAKMIVGVSAPAKGNTLLNFLGRDAKYAIRYITERSKKKIGKFTPGLHIEIFPDSRLIEDQPDYAIIFAHNWSKQIKEALKNYEGEWIVANAEGLKNPDNREFWSRRVSDSKRVTA